MGFRASMGLAVGLFAAALVGAAGAAGATPVAKAPPATEVAVTFDDLPILALTSDLAYAQATNQRLLAGLRRHHIPAIGFVNEGKLEGPDKPARIALLAAWLDAGMDLGNHGYSHLSLTQAPVSAYVADAAKGEVVTRALMAAHGKTERWYRHPYLETGVTPDARAAFEAWLGAHGYRVAPVSMENSDWMFAEPYDEMVLKGDKAGAARIRADYLDYTAKVVPWYEAAAEGVLGRRPAFVLLLHASRLNADSIDALAQILKANGLKPVSLDAAMRDPAYAIPDDHFGPNGDQWVTRWAEALERPMPWKTLPEPAQEVVTADARLDGGPAQGASPVKTGQGQ